MTLRSAGLIVVIAAACSACDSTVTAPTATVTPVDVNAFTATVVPGGSASRAFTLATGGTVGATLTSTTPAGTTLGLGLGIPRSDGSCALSGSVMTVAGSTPQIALAADAGTFCVKVYDQGSLTAPVAFTLSISRP